ncbi:hypothetical protein NM208_g3806 [Fusarium decemcellulare]|uniref:Uncharacterized protein n=1 Tax=Fusarium decemcellulare TaxID=57161 RepID=A0ACC1SN01_9HYPO|nr:hypothetical protein NM208_g3806 [Fusarium decemcellulare]
MSSKLIVIIGATGNQGGSVASVFLKEPGWKVRALTRDTSSTKAQALAAQGAEVIEADIDEPASLPAAFKDANTIFAVSNFWALYGDPASKSKAKPGQPLNVWAGERETEQLKNVIDAAAKVGTLERFILSSLSNATKWSGGKYTHVYHFDSKAKAVDYARDNYPELWAKTSIYQAGLFLSNFADPMSRPIKNADGVVQFIGAADPNVKLPYTVAEEDSGPIVKALLQDPAGRNLIGYREWLTTQEVASIFTKVTGLKAEAIVKQKEHELFIPEDLRIEIQDNIAYFNEFGYEGRNDPTVIHPRDAIQTPASTGPGALALLTAPVKNDYWDLVAQLPPLPIIEDLVDVFFSEVNWHFQILNESFFIELYQTWVRTSPSRNSPPGQTASLELLFFPALLFQVLAIALLFLPESSHRIGSHLADLFHQCNIMLVMIQHDLAKSLWLKSNNKGLASWQFLGRAIRQAQALGLHLSSETVHDCEGGSEDALSLIWLAEHRRRLWATLFSWDSHMAVLLSRPRAINMSDCTAVTPIGCDIPLDRSNALPIPVNPLAKPPMFTNRLFTYALGKKIHEILSLSAHTRQVSDYGIVTRLHNEIVELWRNHHPALRCNNVDTTWDKQYPIVQRQRELAKAMASSVILTLHRDHIAIHPESRFEAMKAALACLEAQDALMSLLPPNQRGIYGLSCHCIDACIFIAYATRLEDMADQGMLDRVQAAIQQSIIRLRHLEDESSFAKHGLRAMEKALESIRSRVQPVDPSNGYARDPPLNTAPLSSNESIEQSLNMTIHSGQFHPGVFEQAEDASLAIADLGVLGFEVAGSLAMEEAFLGEAPYYPDPRGQ